MCLSSPKQNMTLNICSVPCSSPLFSFNIKSLEDEAPIKRCPKCKVYIERDEGCAQMMCKNCKHAFCWYCLESLDVSYAYDMCNLLLDNYYYYLKEAKKCLN